VLDLTAGRNISRDLSVSITALNVANGTCSPTTA
jgi:hypothetical protein